MTEANYEGSGDEPPCYQGIPLVPEPTEAQLSGREITDYAEHRRAYIKWVLNFGKNPDSAEGYAKSTARIRFSRTDQFYRWVWEQEGHYTTAVNHAHADAYCEGRRWCDG